MPETIVRFDDRRPIPAAVFIGNENDNLVERVVFELADWLADATVNVYLTANGKSDVANLGTDRVFDIRRTHTHEAGRWEAYLEAYLNGDRVWHSDEFAMYVGKLPAIGKQIEQQYPTAIEEALKAVEDIYKVSAAIAGLNARAETLPSDSEATVRLEDVDGVLTIVYGIPRGRDGNGDGGGGVDFEVDNNTLVMEDGVLRVNTTDKAEADNTQPITSAGVYTVVGNINAILETI